MRELFIDRGYIKVVKKAVQRVVIP